MKVRHPDYAVRERIVQVLPELVHSHRGLVLELTTLLLHDREMLLRAEACSTVADLKLIELRNEVEQMALVDSNWVVRAEAVETLGDMGDRAALPVLLSAADDPDENVRAYTAIASGLLGTLQDESWLEKWAGREPCERVRNEINAARARLGSDAGWKAFIGAFKVTDTEFVIELLLTIVGDLLERRTPGPLLSDPTSLLYVLRKEAASGRHTTANRARILAERLESLISKPVENS